MKPTRGRSTRTMREVYAIQAATLGLIKIGSADHAQRRLRELQTGSPDRLVLLGSLRTDDALQFEVMFHRRLAAHRLHGEWFAPAPDVLDLIGALMRPPEQAPFGIITTAALQDWHRATAECLVEIHDDEPLEATIERAIAECARAGIVIQ